MKIALGADHAGFELKKQVKAHLQLKHEVVDLGTHSTKPVDYPDFAEAVGLALRDGKAERGILLFALFEFSLLFQADRWLKSSVVNYCDLELPWARITGRLFAPGRQPNMVPSFNSV